MIVLTMFHLSHDDMKSYYQASKPWMQRLQEKWSLSSHWQVAAILVIFTLAGSSVIVLRKWLFASLGYTDQTSGWLKAITYLLFVFPTYQGLLLFYGFLLGQFNFFWSKEKKMLQWLIKKII